MSSFARSMQPGLASIKKSPGCQGGGDRGCLDNHVAENGGEEGLGDRSRREDKSGRVKKVPGERGKGRRREHMYNDDEAALWRQKKKGRFARRGTAMGRNRVVNFAQTYRVRRSNIGTLRSATQEAAWTGLPRWSSTSARKILIAFGSS